MTQNRDDTMQILNVETRYNAYSKHKGRVLFGNFGLHVRWIHITDKENLAALLPEVLITALGVTPTIAQVIADTAVWDIKAGCPCGCSPGYILDLNHIDINVTLGG